MSAPFRISQPRHNPLVAAAAPASGNGLQEYLDRLIKLIPGEIIGFYLLGKGIIPQGQNVALLIFTVLCFLFVFVVRIWGTSDRSAGVPVEWPSVIISAIAFLVWVYSMGDIFAEYGLYVSFIASLLVLIFTFIIPYIYKGTPA